MLDHCYIDLQESILVWEGMILRGWDIYEAGSPKRISCVHLVLTLWQVHPLSYLVLIFQ